MHLTDRVQATIQRLREIFRRDYSAYRESHHWQHLRAVMLELAGNRCEQCDFASFLQVHHRHYRTIGFETPRDLVVLCRRCHAEQHGLPLWNDPRAERKETLQEEMIRLNEEADRERERFYQRRRSRHNL